MPLLIRSLAAAEEKDSLVDLVQYLYTFPYSEHHVTIASNLLSFTTSITANPRLTDELHLLSLQHLFNSMRYHCLITNDTISDQEHSRNAHTLLLSIAEYFNQRYRNYNEIKAAQSKVEEFKYKEYGQKEIEQELDDKELLKSFPSFVRFFDEFAQPVDCLNDPASGAGDKDDEEEENEMNCEEEENSEDAEKSLVDLKFLVESYDLIDKFFEFNNTGLSVQANQRLFENCFLKTFYRLVCICCLALSLYFIYYNRLAGI